MTVRARIFIAALVLIHLAALFPEAFAPHDPAQQFRSSVFMPPGAEFPLGTDGLGRDMASRLLHGARISLATGLLAAAISLILAMALGGSAGYFGGWADRIVMRASELFQALPWLYLLIAIRAALPLHVQPLHAFAILVAVIGIVGWSRPARMIRGVVLSARERDFVTVARGFGASHWYLLRTHVLPEARGVIFTQATLLIPQYILAEVALSFLGLGVAEPIPSWGNMLAALRQYHVMASYWWMYVPGLALVPILFLYQSLADALQHFSRAGRLR